MLLAKQKIIYIFSCRPLKTYPLCSLIQSPALLALSVFLASYLLSPNKCNQIELVTKNKHRDYGIWSSCLQFLHSFTHTHLWRIWGCHVILISCWKILHIRFFHRRVIKLESVKWTRHNERFCKELFFAEWLRISGFSFRKEYPRWS